MLDTFGAKRTYMNKVGFIFTPDLEKESNFESDDTQTEYGNENSDPNSSYNMQSQRYDF